MGHQQCKPTGDQRQVDQAPERQLAQSGLDALADKNANQRYGQRDGQDHQDVAVVTADPEIAQFETLNATLEAIRVDEIPLR
jgi:hypothetical protein